MDYYDKCDEKNKIEQQIADSVNELLCTVTDTDVIIGEMLDKYGVQASRADLDVEKVVIKALKNC